MEHPDFTNLTERGLIVDLHFSLLRHTSPALAGVTLLQQRLMDRLTPQEDELFTLIERELAALVAVKSALAGWLATHPPDH